MRAGTWVTLPSRAQVVLLERSAGRHGPAWLCGYLGAAGQMAGPGRENRGRVVLREDWLRRYGRVLVLHPSREGAAR